MFISVTLPTGRCLPEFRPATGIFREVAPILLRLGKLELEMKVGGVGIDGVVGLTVGILAFECWLAGLTTEIEPAIIFLLLGLPTFTLMKSCNLAPNLAFCPS